MGLLDAFSADSAKKNLYSGQQLNRDWGMMGSGYGEDWTGKGIAAIDSARGRGQDYLQDSNAIARGDITGATDQGLGYLDQGMDQAAGAIHQGIAPQQGLYDRGTAGIDLYTKLLNDPGSYSLTPGAQFQIDTGQEALNRTANSRGMLSSGNNTEDIMRLAQGIASQDYYKNLEARQPYFGLASQGAQGIQSGYNSLAGLYDNLGTNKARLASGEGTALANLESQYGQNASNLTADSGKTIAGLNQAQGLFGGKIRTDLGKSGQDMYGNIANAESAADAQGWNALLGLGGMVTGGLSSFTGAGGSFG
jgi:hypothetical protein